MVCFWVLSPYIILGYLLARHKSKQNLLLIDLMIIIIISAFGIYKWIEITYFSSDPQAPIAIGIVSIFQILFIIGAYVCISIIRHFIDPKQK